MTTNFKKQTSFGCCIFSANNYPTLLNQLYGFQNHTANIFYVNFADDCLSSKSKQLQLTSLMAEVATKLRYRPFLYIALHFWPTSLNYPKVFWKPHCKCFVCKVRRCLSAIQIKTQLPVISTFICLLFTTNVCLLF